MNPIKITSKDNAQIKLLKKLNLRKYRDEEGMFFVENATIIVDALKSGHDFKLLFASEDFIHKNKDKFSFIAENFGLGEYFLIDERINKFFSNLDVPSGICAVYGKREKPIDYDSPTAYLNGINDPGNLGTIMRSALAFSFKNIIVDERCTDIYNPKTISAAKDSVFKLNIAHDKNLSLLKTVKKKMKICSAVLAPNAEDVAVIKKIKPVCIVLGSEAHGVDEGIMKLSDKLVKIRILNMESLNVACAATILFYEYGK